VTGLTDLHREILFNVAGHLADDVQTVHVRHFNLCNLAFTTRQFRSIAQETLFRSILVRPPCVHKVSPDNVVELRPSRIALLYRTLLERRDLASKVQRLELFVWGEGPRCLNLSHTAHAPLCNGSYRFGWYDIMQLFRKHLQSNSVAWANPEMISAWLQRHQLYMKPDETALAGVALSCTIRLQGLDLISLSNLDSWPSNANGYLHDDHELEVAGYYYPWVPQTKDLFGFDSLPLGFNFSFVPAFSCLKAIRCSEPVSWDFICLPELKTLYFALDNVIICADHVDKVRLLPAPYARPAVLTSVVIEVAISMLLSNPNKCALRRYEYLEQELLPNLPALIYFELRIGAVHGLDAGEDRAVSFSLHHIGTRVRSKTLETLLIDLTNIDIFRVPSERISPSFSPEHLPKLRRLIAPEMFCFPVDYDLYCALPTSIESIEVVDFSNDLDDYGIHLLESQALYLNLKKMVGCYLEEDYNTYQTPLRVKQHLKRRGVEAHWWLGDHYDWQEL
jgi:hypothetical protein